MKPWSLARTVQCAKCPWRVSTDPNEIPNGYDVKKHRQLERTIAKEGDLSGIYAKELRIMACHETHQAHCLGWLMHQLGPGNNLALRIACLSCENLDEVKLCGPQHARFEDTLPE